MKQKNILAIGNHRKIIQSVLDFDFMSGKLSPSVSGIVSGNNKASKYWFGESEILLPAFSTIADAKQAGINADYMLNLSSANSTRNTTEDFFKSYPDAWGGHLFCEGLSEQDALQLINQFGGEKYIAGASGVGFVRAGEIKLGAIGGIFGNNVIDLSKKSGTSAIVCSSGGMVNELIDVLMRNNSAPSFAVSYGGDRFPITSPLDWCLMAEKDSATKHIIFFGELGGVDEYDIATAVAEGKITKPVFAYVAGWYDTAGEVIQFGHAKALAKNPDESAGEKTKALYAVGVNAYTDYSHFIEAIKNASEQCSYIKNARSWTAPDEPRRASLFSAVEDRGKNKSNFTEHILCTLLEREEVSPELVEVSDYIFSLLVDHGIEPSGPLNTVITTRAGKDMSSSVASGLLAIGDRFGGAVNESARTWFDAVRRETRVFDLLNEHKKSQRYVMGIGHKKYTSEANDPRVEKLVTLARKKVDTCTHLDYALSVAEVTTQKRSNLILNIDGAIAAIVLDILIEKESLSKNEIAELLDISFFNSFFVIPRTAGMVANHLSQKRRDEGLFRLPEDEVYYM